MKNMHRCILCIGSNYRAETYMGMAEMLLNQRFPSIRWGKLIKTLPEETSCGRTSLSKQTGIIPLDIDLLMIDNTVLKPEDMQKHYVRQALEGLEEK